jgi:Leucine-rich repeat (LRR) protein
MPSIWNIENYLEWIANKCPLNTSVIRLDLSDCCLETLNPSICNLLALIKLDISKNPIKELPDELSDCDNLEYINISDTEITSIQLVILRSNIRQIICNEKEIQINDCYL